MPAKDLEVKKAIQSVLGTRRWGRKKLMIKVQKAYPSLSLYRIRKVYTQEGFSLFRRPRRARTKNPANPIQIPLAKNEEWTMDFMSDVLSNGRKLRTLNVLDQYNRQCLGIGVEYNMPSWRVVEHLERVIAEHGKPKSIRTDNGSEFTSKYFQLWLEKNQIKWVKIQAGKPQQNAIIERFNRSFREDVLDANIIPSLEHLRELAHLWKNEYNNERPHEALNFKTPNQYVA